MEELEGKNKDSCPRPYFTLFTDKRVGNRFFNRLIRPLLTRVNVQWPLRDSVW